MQFVIDIEANGLLDKVTEIWCIIAKEVGTMRVSHFYHSDEVDLDSGDLSVHYFPEFLRLMLEKREPVQLIFHNGINYDIPLLHKILGLDLKEFSVIDTLIMSRVLNPDRPGGHSLESWMTKLGLESKIQNKDWSKYDPIMISRCEGDVLATEKVFDYLKTEIKQTLKCKV